MSLRREFVSGVFYTAVSKYAGIIIGIAISAILSRLLAPKDFGVLGLSGVFISFFGIFSELGIGTAIVQRKDLTKEELNNIFSFTVYQGLILAVLFFFSSYIFADIYHSEILRPICQVMSLNLFFGSFSIVSGALITREKRFRFLAVRNLTIQVVFGVISIIAALLGAGLWALVISGVGGGIASSLVNYFTKPLKFHIKIDSRPLRSIASYSFYQFAFGTTNFFYRNLDNLLIGKYLNMTELGYYQKSYSLMLQPVDNLTRVVSPVLQPVLADYQNNPTFIEEKYNKLLKSLSIFGFPISVILLLNAKEIILILFGNQWVGAILPFQILAVSIGFQVIMSTTGSIFQVLNNTRLLFWVGLSNTIICIVCLLIGLFVIGTLEGVSLMFTLMNFLICYNWPLMYHKLFHSSVRSFWKAIKPGIIASLFLLIFCLPLYFYLFDSNLILSLTIKLIYSVCIILLSYHFMHILNLKELCKTIQAKIFRH